MRMFLTMAACGLLAACGQQPQEAAPPETEIPAGEEGLEVVSRNIDSATGRALFIDKGCVICHAVNGVGGKAAPALDAEIGEQAIDPLEFAARMWRGAPAMIELQSIELGYSIYLTADEIADLAAFASDREEQKRLSADQLPENIRGGLLDEQFWEMEDWDDFLRSGQERGLPADDMPADDEGPAETPDEESPE